MTIREWLRGLRDRLCGQRPQEEVLHLRSENQTLRLEVEALRDELEQIRISTKRERDDTEQRVRNARDDAVATVFRNIATPFTQLLTQKYLSEIQGIAVDVPSVMRVIHHLTRVLQDQGLSIEANVGEMVQFEPQKHKLMDANRILSPGQQCIVRVVGLSYQNNILSKAGVALVETVR